MVPVPNLPLYPDDATHAPAVKVLIVLVMVAAVVFVLFALVSRRWVGRSRAAAWIFGVALFCMVGGFVAAFVVDKVTLPDRQAEVAAQRAAIDAQRDATLQEVARAYGVKIEDGWGVPTEGRSIIEVTFPDGDEVKCYLRAGTSLTLECPRPLPQDPATS